MQKHCLWEAKESGGFLSLFVDVYHLLDTQLQCRSPFFTKLRRKTLIEG
jgi:hypothetical protein